MKKSKKTLLDLWDMDMPKKEFDSCKKGVAINSPFFVYVIGTIDRQVGLHQYLLPLHTDGCNLNNY